MPGIIDLSGNSSHLLHLMQLNNNTNTADSVYNAVMQLACHLVHLVNVVWCRVAANRQIKRAQVSDVLIVLQTSDGLYQNDHSRA